MNPQASVFSTTLNFLFLARVVADILFKNLLISLRKNVSREVFSHLQELPTIISNQQLPSHPLPIQNPHKLVSRR